MTSIWYLVRFRRLRAIFWERAAHSVYCMMFLYFDIVILVISHFGFEGGTLVLIASISGH